MSKHISSIDSSPVDTDTTQEAPNGNGKGQKTKSKLFIAFMPDYEDELTLTKRLKVREEHLNRFQREKEMGMFTFGRGYLPPPQSSLHSHPSLKPGQQAMAGSVLLMTSESLSAAWERVKDDVYWTAGVWDKERGRVEEFVKMPGDEE
ncbi:hypothetical protein TREMEDRAFT_33268 [Tremella mesenterica DSM 1558]|uniref:uncharacterized protein n=1 Tax=Tremella mesenterica (strain ATCC 24925 / CBS 8224 / DSM 1558 / NBRC 9311 / NRRL Y-6157 / RJB 2259-6 / UBC 559-6) TaxID=578456 RepID=UPI0003F4A417|nr:uncharacterized protein TREMEDRAFT_33268 [Tremella mesenterica DSM 1558]EIW67764.1 hypothetical protein TREMEDRAFT_33268 [Tremella mesenterica DSM 1558]